MEKVIKILSVCFFIISFVILLKALFLNFYPDLSQYYFGAKSLNPYLNGVIYPPFALVIFSALGLIPFVWLEKIWIALSIASLFTTVYLIFRLNSQRLFSTLGFVVMGLVCLTFPVKFTLGMGQINNFILLIFVLAIYLLNKKKDYLSGFLLSLSFAIKLFPAYLLIYFIFAKKWKPLFVFVSSLALISLIAFVLVDPKLNLYFYQNFLPTLLNGWKTDYYNQSLTGFIGRSFSQNIYSQLAIIFSSLFLIILSVVVVFKSLKDKTLMNMNLGLLVALNLMVNNFSWQHHFVFLLFPFLVTLFYIRKIKNNGKLVFVLLISYVLVSINLANPHGVAVFLQSHVFYGTTLLWALQLYLIWRDSRKLGLNS